MTDVLKMIYIWYLTPSNRGRIELMRGCISPSRIGKLFDDFANFRNAYEIKQEKWWK